MADGLANATDVAKLSVKGGADDLKARRLCGEKFGSERLQKLMSGYCLGLVIAHGYMFQQRLMATNVRGNLEIKSEMRGCLSEYVDLRLDKHADRSLIFFYRSSSLLSI